MLLDRIIVAYRKSNLPKYIESLPLGNYAIGDNAYICTEHLLTPFSGDQKKNVYNFAYNFYLSQCRIRIEMAFGRLVNKWRIFRRPLQVRLKHVGRLFLCATRLHNFCIDERLLDEEETKGPVHARAPRAHDEADEQRPLCYVPSTIKPSSIQGNSIMRDRLLAKIKRENLRRPAHNMQRNRNNR
jgi:DDE superfamily endonuclease